MTEKRQKFGKAGEEAAVAFLKKKGYRIVQKNFKTAVGEIDIIAENDKAVIFIEVKTRFGGQFGHPSLAVSPHKQKKLVQTEESFLVRYKIKDRDMRFDVLSVTGSPDAPDSWNIEPIENAFYS